VTSVAASVIAANAGPHKDVGEDALETDALPSNEPQDAEMATDAGHNIKETSSDNGDKVANNVPG
jgi:hypothetical protein